MRPDMILDNGWASRGQKSRFKSSLPTGTDGKGREAALAATEGGGEGLPQGGEGPRRAGLGPPVTRRCLYIISVTGWDSLCLLITPHGVRCTEYVVQCTVVDIVLRPPCSY